MKERFGNANQNRNNYYYNTKNLYNEIIKFLTIRTVRSNYGNALIQYWRCMTTSKELRQLVRLLMTFCPFFASIIDTICANTAGSNLATFGKQIDAKCSDFC